MVSPFFSISSSFFPSPFCPRPLLNATAIIIAITCSLFKLRPHLPSVTVYSGDSFGGGDTVLGYGWTHLPTRPGVHHLEVTLFAPTASTALGRLSSWLGTARPPEFVDDRMAAGSEGRSLVEVRNTGGVVRLNLSILFKDFKKYGFVSR